MQKPKHFISWTISNWQYPGRPPFPLCPWHRCQATGTEVLREIPGKLHGLFYVKDFCCVVAMDNSEGNIRKRADRVYLRATPPAGSMVIHLIMVYVYVFATSPAATTIRLYFSPQAVTPTS